MERTLSQARNPSWLVLGLSRIYLGIGVVLPYVALVLCCPILHPICYTLHAHKLLGTFQDGHRSTGGPKLLFEPEVQTINATE